jgi:branched-subunit amino acid transport protein AzlD
MGLLVWSMMGIAIWHFAVFVPDRFWGGIVGAFMAALAGAVVMGLLVYGFAGRDIDSTDLGTALIAVPGAALGLVVSYGLGLRAETD